MICSSHRIERLQQRGKQIVALEISSWFAGLVLHWRFWMSLQSVMFRRCPFSASYIVSHITCFAWTSGSGTIVPPYLRGQLGGTSPHRRILIQAVNAAHCWLFSHTGHHLGCYCVCLIYLFIYFRGSPCNLSWKQRSWRILGLWMMGHNVAQQDNSSIYYADQREDTSSRTFDFSHP